MAKVRVLLVEDSPDDAELVLREIARAGLEFIHHRVDSESALESALREEWDLVISDFQMPAFDGLRAFEIVKQRHPDVPYIFASGVLGEERAVTAMRAGARDFVLKGHLNRLGPIVRRELVEAEHRRRAREAERALEVEHRRYHGIFDFAAVGLIELDFSDAIALAESSPGPADDPAGRVSVAQAEKLAGATRILAANLATANMLGIEEPRRLVGPASSSLRFTPPEAWIEILQVLRGRGGEFAKQLQLETWDRRKRDVLVTFRVPPTPGEVDNVVMSLVDVSDRVSLERQMRAAQRLEAIGRLAGGVAHDFNNILTVIHSYSGFILDSLPPGDPIIADVETIKDAAQRAEGLTRQLLAFSRCQVSEPRALSINQFVSEMDRMLRRVIGEDIDLETTLDPALGLVEIDPSHIEQIIMNLAVNARDAMPTGGKLTIETGNVSLDAQYTAEVEPSAVPPGEYVLLAMSDTGSGMDEETRSKIFEPFFTTKEAGKGTGLGLSTVYGIVSQAEGFIWVYSEIGRGTTFKIYLPRRAGTGESYVADRRASAVSFDGAEVVLLVEDEEPVRRAAERILQKAGYQVVAAASGEDALAAAAGFEGSIQVLLTDMVMPQMNGKELADRLCALRPELKVLYMSGYTSNAIVHQGVLDPDVAFVHKPFTSGSLLRRLREVLDEG